MTLLRGVILLAGTFGIVAVCYALAAPRGTHPVPVRTPSAETAVIANEADLSRQCEQLAAILKAEKSSRWAVLVRSPFVLSGDVPAERLQELHRDIIIRTAQALSIDYFDRSPCRPVIVFVLATDDSYRAALEQLGQSRRVEYSGLYQREERTIWFNASTGAGTLAHELTHALAHVDFPEMPEWFDEGLASLHEESEFSDDGLHLVGRDNWRRRFLEDAIIYDRWKPLDRLLSEPFAQSDVAALDYALSRSLCLYLQQRGLLAPYYRKCRGLSSRDPSGRAALLRLFPGKTIDDVDQDLRDWLASSSDNGMP